uniref:hypothetical protein n=1 Tax=Aerococcus urinaeequi TaxID=51665 RepID=UPI00352B8918
MRKIKHHLGLLVVLIILLSLISEDLSLMKITLVALFIIWILFSDKLIDFWNS